MEKTFVSKRAKFRYQKDITEEGVIKYKYHSFTNINDEADEEAILNLTAALGAVQEDEPDGVILVTSNLLTKGK